MKRQPKEFVGHHQSELHTHPRLERELGVPEGHVIIDSEAFDKARSLVDGAYETILACKPESPAQEAWRSQWLADARKLGAGLDEPPTRRSGAKPARCEFCDPTMRPAEFCHGCPHHPLEGNDEPRAR